MRAAQADDVAVDQHPLAVDPQTVDLVPLVEPRSTIVSSVPGRTSAWRRLTLGSLRVMVHSGNRPSDTTRWPTVTRSPEGSCSRPTALPRRVGVDATGADVISVGIGAIGSDLHAALAIPAAARLVCQGAVIGCFGGYVASLALGEMIENGVESKRTADAWRGSLRRCLKAMVVAVVLLFR